MVNLTYDGSWYGFLSAVFEVYEKKFSLVSILKEAFYLPEAFAGRYEVATNKLKAERVWNGLLKHLPVSSCKNIYCCYLSEIPGIENTLLKFIQLAFSTKEAEKAFANPAVLKVSQVAKMVHRERHRMEAFVRFKLTKDNIYFAEIEPDFNVLPLVTEHFRKRYADQKWLIYDLRRKYGIYYNLESVEEITFASTEDWNTKGESSVFEESEELYQSLWKDYFQHVNIQERKNTKLHLRHVPKRYWKYLVEKGV
ncbi:TIGR03915 family putative DNA repair protein [Desertivirga arenae]|uniref:TIGR03915 family putative DNA repair protein n=1 Tax=Desertivirga arenae TaxID=2810309 RepID=UPI001A96A540|nr:TIGR03915 family putative DNA repair protein [Pedobacter sp. SYSU D00823]